MDKFHKEDIFNISWDMKLYSKRDSDTVNFRKFVKDTFLHRVPPVDTSENILRPKKYIYIYIYYIYIYVYILFFIIIVFSI